MKEARLWVIVLALTSFLAGTASGILFAQQRFSTAPEKGPFTDYHRLLADHFELDGRRTRLLRELLQSYQRDLDRIRDRYTADYLSAMEPELRERGIAYRRLIRDRLIPEDRRAEFDRLAAEYVVNL